MTYMGEMMMKGSLLTHILQNGRKLLNAAIAMLVLTLFLSSCSAEWWLGDGRGDWYLELINGYCIDKVNSKEIVILNKKNPVGQRFVVPNYFVTAYQLHEPYICLEGIQTQKLPISEDELNARVLSYYLIDTTNDEVMGPYESCDAFAEHCSSLALEIDDEWIEPKPSK